MYKVKINIILNFFRGIAGGYKVVYQYANFLVSEGHDVTIYYDLHNGVNSKRIPKKIMLLVRKNFLKKYPYYFSLEKSIKQIGIKDIENNLIRDADICILTSPNVANGSINLDTKKGKKIYFIQGYENWWNDEKFLNDSYKICEKNIVISEWLKEIVDKYSKNKSVVICNGIDLSKFKVINRKKDRIGHSISMVYHLDEIKGCKYGLDAIYRLKLIYPDLVVNIFGNPKRPKALPKWINYKQKASEDEIVDILNNSSIFMCTSIHEGFGLPGLEAMACGCVLVTTNCFGPLEYANERNAIICETKEPNQLFEGVKRVFENDNLKNSLLQQAKIDVEKWDIKKSMHQFEKEIFNKN